MGPVSAERDFPVPLGFTPAEKERPERAGWGAGSAFGIPVRQLRMLAEMARRLRGPADAAFLANLGWAVAAKPDSPLPLELMSRAAAGGATRAEAAALARLLLMRSVRCVRAGPAYLELARSVLSLNRQIRPEDARLALWLAGLYLLTARYAEAQREASAVRDPQFEALASSLRVCAGIMMGRSPAARMTADAVAPSGVDPAVRAFALHGEKVQMVGGAPGRFSERGVDLVVRAFRGKAVTLEGPRFRVTLSAFEGELALALLALIWSGFPEDGRAEEWVSRSRWATALWPLPEHPVGRLSGLFSQVIRRLRLKAQAAAGEPVIEVTHRLGYRVRPRLVVALEMDFPCLVANWLVARIPAGPPG